MHTDKTFVDTETHTLLMLASAHKLIKLAYHSNRHTLIKPVSPHKHKTWVPACVCTHTHTQSLCMCTHSCIQIKPACHAHQHTEKSYVHPNMHTEKACVTTSTHKASMLTYTHILMPVHMHTHR